MRTAMLLLCLLGGSLAAQAPADSAERYPLSFYQTPEPGWSKLRLEGEVLPDNTGFRIHDIEADAFDDAEQFRVDSIQTLPYGDKLISVTVEVGADHVPLWDNKLLQFQVNGREPEVWVDADGTPDFELDMGGDGKGFIPAEDGTYRFRLDKGLEDLRFISFMTAGAEQYDATLRDIEVTVWPEEDTRPRDYLLFYNRLGYVEDQRRWVVLEWQEDLEVDALPVTLRRAGGSEDNTRFEASAEPYAGSGRRQDLLDFGHREETGFYTVIVPEAGGRTRHTTATFQVREFPEPYLEHRDQAWGAFHYVDSAAYEGAHEQDARARVFGTDSETMDIRGGWYDAGDYGKYVVNGAWTVALPLLTWLMVPEVLPEEIEPLADRNPERPATLDLLKQELDWLLTMQRDDGAVHHKAASAAWPPLTDSPLDDDRIKWVMPISTTATANFSSVMYMAAAAYRQSPLSEDHAQADVYEAAADEARAFLLAHPDMIMIEDRYDNIEYGGPYADYDDTDERLWAEVARLWVEPDDAGSAALFARLLALTEEPRLGDAVPDWRHVNFLALFNYLALPQVDAEQRAQLLAAVEDNFRPLRQDQLAHPYGLMYAGLEDGFDWGSNGVIATVGSQLLWLHHLTGEPEWYDAAFDMSHWFFGLNPHGMIWTTGLSRHQVQAPHFRPWVSGTVSNPQGLIAGGPNSYELKGDMAAQPYFDGPPMMVYTDHQDSWATNEIAINWQAAWANYLSLLTGLSEQRP
ncbi:glycoside hydrolase family 9 protein [Natronospirillum operosum]|nr:glycoside hydrolase family 9 protein [Natronospirillum operosum]